MTKIERAVPPVTLTRLCDEEKPAPRDIFVTRDIVESRQDWKAAFDRCAAKLKRLVEWNTQTPASP